MPRELCDPPVCPRCGYDQSGVIAAWTIKCPLHHKCSECGLELDLARVVNPQRYRVAWFFEHLPRRRLGFLAPWLTWCRVVLPWRFWRERDGVRLDSEFSLARLSLWLPMLVAPVWLLYAILSSGRTIIWYYCASNSAATPGTEFLVAVVANGLLEPLGVGYFNGSLQFQFVMFLPYHVKAWLVCCVMMPVLILMLSRSRLTCRVRSRHVLRASAYSFGLVALWPLFLMLSPVVETVPWPSAVVSAIGGPWNEEAWNKAMLVSGLLGVAWFASWWYVVIVRVFQLRHAHWVWALLMLACVLVFGIVAAIENGLDWLFMG